MTISNTYQQLCEDFWVGFEITRCLIVEIGVHDLTVSIMKFMSPYNATAREHLKLQFMFTVLGTVGTYRHGRNRLQIFQNIAQWLTIKLQDPTREMSCWYQRRE